MRFAIMLLSIALFSLYTHELVLQCEKKNWCDIAKKSTHNILLDYYFHFILFYEASTETVIIGQCFDEKHTHTHTKNEPKTIHNIFVVGYFSCNGLTLTRIPYTFLIFGPKLAYTFFSRQQCGMIVATTTKSIDTDTLIDYHFFLLQYMLVLSVNVMRLLNYINTEMSTHFLVKVYPDSVRFGSFLRSLLFLFC